MKDKQSPYTILKFDSKLFGYTVARLGSDVTEGYLPKALAELTKRNVKLVYWFVSPEDIEKNRWARANGGTRADEKIEYVMEDTLYQKKTVRFPSGIQVYNKSRPDPEVLSLALQSGIYSRFATDRHFKHDEYKKLYTTWITKAASAKRGLGVVTFTDENGRVRGMVTLETDGDIGRIGLLAVDESYRGRSIGRTLMEAARASFRKRRLRAVYVATQKKNIVARKFYEALGYKKVKTENVYHFWL